MKILTEQKIILPEPEKVTPKHSKKTALNAIKLPSKKAEITENTNTPSTVSNPIKVTDKSVTYREKISIKKLEENSIYDAIVPYAPIKATSVVRPSSQSGSSRSSIVTGAGRTGRNIIVGNSKVEDPMVASNAATTITSSNGIIKPRPPSSQDGKSRQKTATPEVTVDSRTHLKPILPVNVLPSYQTGAKQDQIQGTSVVSEKAKVIQLPPTQRSIRRGSG